jgi:hypothetical protein
MKRHLARLKIMAVHLEALMAILIHSTIVEGR